MIRFIIGRAGSGKSTFVQDEVCRVMRGTGDSAVVIVPEQQTVLWETKMAEMLPESANLRLEITNFTRLSNSVFREYGGLSDSPIDEGTRTLLVWRAMAEMMPTLRTCGDGESKKGGLSRLERAVPRMMKAVDELKNSAVTPAEAEEALRALSAENDERDSGVGLVARLSDAVGVYAAYSSLLGERGIDRHDVLGKLANTLREHEYFAGKHVFVDSFFSMTSAEEQILLEIMRQAESVTLTFACPANPTGEVQFAETEDFLKKAKSFAARAGREWEIVPLTENRRHVEGSALAAVEEYLFDYARDIPTVKCTDSSVRVIKCADRYDEAECAAAIIDRLVRSGATYSDIAITASDMRSREGVIDAVLRRHGIRSFMSESAEVSTSPLVRLITSALRVEEGGWAREDIIKLIKTGLTPLSVRGERAISLEDVFETYTDTWNIRGRKMYTADAWSMNPEGYKITMSDTSREMLAAANEAREMLIPHLDSLLSVFDGGVAATSEIAERIVYFMEDMGVCSSLSRMAQSYSEIEMSAMAKKTMGMYAAVLKILERMVDVLGDMMLDAGTFAGLFQRVAATFDVGSIPTGIDEVILGSASGLRVDGVKYMIILGSVDGEFPSAVDTGRDYFDDRDKVALEGVGLNIKSPDTELCRAREYFMYYRATSTPREELYVLAPCGGEADLSEGAARILAITGCEAESFASMPLSEVVFTPVAAEYQLARRSDPAERALLDELCARGGEDIPLVTERDIAVTEKYRSVDGRVNMGLSESRVETFAKCPFSYSCKYLLKISPTAKAEITTPDIGTFMHSVLERFFTSLSEDEMASMPLPAGRVEKMADAIISDYVRSLSIASGGNAGSDAEELDGRLSYLFIRLRRHVLVFLDSIMRELSRSKLRPARCELPIGLGDGSVDPITFSFEDGEDAVNVVLRGIADRVDVYKEDGKTYLRVIDYKTGAKTFSPDDVKKGIGVQLLVYLFSLMKSGIPGVTEGEIIPAAATYFSAKPNSVSVESVIGADEARELLIDGVRKSGIVILEDGVLSVIDDELAEKIVHAKVNENGQARGIPDTVIMSAEKLGEMQGEIEKVVCEIASKIKRGVSDASPMKVGGKSPCEYCDMKYICRRRES